MIFRFSSPFRLLAEAAVTAWGKFAGYQVLAPDDVKVARTDICEKCSFMTEDRQCRVCTCFVDFKVWLALQKCPKKKWLRVWVKKVKI